MSSLLNIPESVSLAFHGLALLVGSAPQRLSAGKMAETLRSSEAHLAKVFQKLHRAGLVESVRGPAGGFTLAVAAQSTSLLDVFVELEGPLQHGKCPVNKPACPLQRCIFAGRLQPAVAELEAVLAGITLDSFSRGQFRINNSSEQEER